MKRRKLLKALSGECHFCGGLPDFVCVECGRKCCIPCAACGFTKCHAPGKEQWKAWADTR